jgi:hypothetical protein
VNPGDAAVTGTLTVYGGGLAGDAAAPDVEPVTQPLEVPPRGRVAVRLADVLEAQFASALVELDGGEVVVEHVVRGADDLDAAPCATSPSPTWHVAAGATTRDARERLVLFNPFPDDAVVDITFTTAEGVREPEDYQGFVVPARRVVGVDVGAAVQRHPQVSLTVAARSGRLVVDRLQTFDGSAGPEGLALTPAAPEPAALWYFPDGRKVEGRTDVLTVYNPTDQPAEVDVEVVLDPSSDPAVLPIVEPIALSIAPRRFAQVDLAAEERIPAELGFSLVVVNHSGRGVVAERQVRSADPEPRTGYAATLGSPVTSTRWLTAVGGTGEEESEFIVVVNTSLDSIARVSVVSPAPTRMLVIDDLQDIEIQPGGRLRIDLGDHVSRETLPLIVTATQPVVVERITFPAVGGLGQSMAVAASVAEVPTVEAGASAFGS